MPSYWSDKDERQYKDIKQSLIKAGRDPDIAESVAAATVNKRRKKEGRTKKKGMVKD